MPIKFRCQQCRQFLGISRAQAGEVVDCPTCGRTIRVPELDGTVKPLPEPGLKFDDTRLKNALDEIALIGDKGSQSEKQKDKDAATGSAVKGEVASSDVPGSRGAVATDEPRAIDLPPLPAPEPVVPGPLPQRDIDYGAAADDDALSEESLEEDRPWRSTAQPRDSWKQLIAAAALKEQEEWGKSKADEDELSEDSEAASEASASDVEESSPADETAQVVSVLDRDVDSLGFSTWLAIIGLIVLICSAGFWIGRNTAITFSAVGPGSIDAEKSAVSPEASVAEALPKSGVEGRITFRSDTRPWSADRDACVIVLPLEGDGHSRISVHGLQRGDSNEDREIVNSLLGAMGGAVSFADEHGHFQIELKQPGEYHVLVLSRSVGRPAASDDQAAIEVLDRYFDRAEQLLGDLAYRLETIRITGDSSIPLDTGFRSQD